MTRFALLLCASFSLSACTADIEAAQHEETVLNPPATAPISISASAETADSPPSPTIMPSPTVTPAPASSEPVKLAQLGGTYSARQYQNHFPVRRCINMGNALEADNEGDWGYTIKAQDFRTIARAGFDTVRIPVRWDLKTAKRPPYRVDPAHTARVIEVVSQAQAAGLGVIIDVHHYRALVADASGPEAARFLAIWDQIASAFASAPRTVYFELLNEPTEASAADLNALYARALAVIRRTNPTRAVIIGGNRWNSIDTMSQVRFPRDPYLVATYHDYDPHEFTHQGADWDENPSPLGRKWGTQEDIGSMRATIAQASAFKARTGLPVFVGEFGVIDTVPLAERAAWVKSRRRAMEQAGLSWCAWDFSGRFKAYDLSRRTWLPSMKSALTGR